MKKRNTKQIYTEYQLLSYIIQTSKDRSIAHILERLENLKKMMKV